VIPALVGVYNPAKRSELADCPATNALEWLADQQSGVDGGYGTNSSSVESLLSIGANGLDADQWRRSSISPTLMSNIFVNGPDFASTGADAAGKLAVGLAGSNGCWPFGASTPEHYYDPTTGQYAVGAGLQSWAVLGVVALSDTVPISATQFLSSLQQPDGGWEFLPGGFGEGTDTNSTALALQALIATGTAIDSSEVISGLNYLKAAQNNDGGFPYDADSPWGTGSDTNSTSYVVQAIMAAGQNPSDSAWLNDSNSPIDFLLSMQLPDGSFEYQNGFGSNLFATQQAIPALLERSYPLVDTGLNSCPLIFLPFIENN
jgi:hypothetical protein